jgi:hypothetical protein
LIFLTLLWIGFTLLEMSDSPRLPSVEYDGVEVESWAIFERTWMEFVLNSILLSGWISESKVPLLFHKRDPTHGTQLINSSLGSSMYQRPGLHPPRSVS